MPDLQESIFVVRPALIETLTDGPTGRAASGIMLDDPVARHGVLPATLHPFKIVPQGR